MQTRLAMVAAATESIDVAYYEIHDDSTTGQFLAALQSASARGIRVRMLSDGHVGGNALPKVLVEHLIESGICFRERPVDVRYQLEIGRPRLHDKLLIIDHRELLTGGRNLTESYFGIGCQLSIDRDIYVRGPSAVCAAEYFQQRWNEPQSDQPTLTRTENPRVVKRQSHPQWNDMDRGQAKAAAIQWLALCAQLPIAARDANPCRLQTEMQTIDDCSVRFLHDFSGRSKRTPGSIGPEVLSRLERARDSIDIETPYFAITHRLRSVLVQAARRGVRVRVLTNSLESTDQVLVHAGYTHQRRGMLRAGIELYEYQGRNTLHAKALIIDGATIMVGSYNFDVLSETRNSEVAVLIESRGLAKELMDSMGEHRRRANQVDLFELLRYEARESDASTEVLRKFQRARWLAPIAKPYL
jgi:putative cardiolipin synthase